MIATNRVLAVVAPVAALMLAPTLALADDDGSATAAAGEISPPPASVPSYTLLSATLSGAPEIDDVEDGRRPPVGYTEVHRKRTGLLVSGATLLAASYGFSAYAAVDNSSWSGGGSTAAMWIPVAGPFIELGQLGKSACDDGVCPQALALVALGAAQAAGAVMTYFGATSTKRVWVRNDRLSDVVVSPMVGANAMTGLSLSGKW